MGVSLYTSRVILNVLGIENYGIYTIIGGVVGLFGFFNAAMSSATQRFLAIDIGRKDWDNLQKTFNSTLIVHIGIAALVLLVAETVGLWFVNNKLNIPISKIGAVNFVYQFSILSSIIAITQVPFNALIIAHEKMNVFALISVIEVTLKLLIVYLLLVSPFNKLETYSALILFVTFIVSIIYKVYCNKNFKESKFVYYNDKEMYKVLISYSGWSLFGNIAAIAKEQGINILLNIFFGTLLNAAFGIMLQVQNAVNSFVINFQTAINPQLFKYYANNELDKMFKLMFQSSKLTFYLMLLLIFPVIYNVDFILNLWLKTPPEYASSFVILNLVFLAIDNISNSLMKAVQATGKIKWYQIILGTFIFLNLPISYLFMKLGFGPEFFLYTSIAISFLSLLFRLFYIRLLMPFPSLKFMKSVLVPIVCVIFSSYLILSFIHLKAESFQGLIVNSLITFIIVFVIILIIGLNKNERDSIKKIIYEKNIKKNCR